MTIISNSSRAVWNNEQNIWKAEYKKIKKVKKHRTIKEGNERARKIAHSIGSLP